MGRGAIGFATGLLQGGLRGYQMNKEWERQDAKDAADKEERDLRVDAAKRKAEQDRAEQAAINDYKDMLKTGTVVDQNTSGFSDAAVNQLMRGGGQQAVDDAASYANAEARRFGVEPRNTTSVGTAPTVTTRPLDESDRVSAIERIAAARGDVNLAYTLGKRGEEIKNNRADMDAVKRVMADPNGKDAQDLIGMVGGLNVPGVSVRTDPESQVSYMEVVDSAGKPQRIDFSGANLGRLMVVQQKIQRGDASALTDLAAISKDLSAAGAADWKYKAEVAKFNNNARRTDLAVNADRRAASEQTFSQNTKITEEEQKRRALEAGAKVAEAAGWKPDQVEAVRAGALKPPGAGGDSNQPAEVKIAQAILNAGLASDMKSALHMAMQTKADSPEKLQAEIYQKALVASRGNPKRAQEATEQAMRYLSQGAGAPAPSAGASASAAYGAVGGNGGAVTSLRVGQVVNGYQFKGGDPKDKANWSPAASTSAR